ncbi:hypothetical protein [Methylocella silvestris]|uniref:Fibronectin type-III domain-containing protein n=1 Tax=Methylocella silvestris TaxID=199596 RepID=A0A2J7TDW1_METSI|nr:hypothetical protein [Methylocella silvestris]PNG24956.1 hypothetical protein CR492_15760 [Methylocella silvestris]
MIGLQLIAVAIVLTSTGDARGEEPGASGGGISYEEQLRFTPPAPLRPTASRKGSGLLICWSPPQPLKEHVSAYDPAVVRYRVYALDANHDRVAIGETERACFLDERPAAKTVTYAVTAIQRSGHESALSADALVPP